jgi:DNA modification methylase
MPSPIHYQLLNGDSSKMDILRNNEVDLILTSPPYFSKETEKELCKPLTGQIKVAQVREDIKDFALSLTPNYKEMARVLKEGGFLALQTMDIYYGGIIIPLTSIHIEMAENQGLNLISHFHWVKYKRHSSAKRFLDNPRIGKCRNEMYEDITIFSKGLPNLGNSLKINKKELKESINPHWSFVPVGKNKTHPHQTPKGLVKRLIGLYSSKGDLAVDPFAGSGTTLRVAKEMGRNSIGYEIDKTYIKEVI